MRTELLRFNGAVERDPAIDAWMKEHSGELGAVAHQWFEVNLRRLDLASNFPQIGNSLLHRLHRTVKRLDMSSPVALADLVVRRPDEASSHYG